MKTVLVSGALANKPRNGGNAWSRMSWVSGFRRLGFEVCFIEQIDHRHCVDSAGASVRFEDSVNRDYFSRVMDQFGLAASSALLCDGGRQVHGLSLAELESRARRACLLFNMSGHLTQPDLRNRAACELYYDDDPGFTQFWHATGEASAPLEQHHFHYTLGANIGRPECSIPTGTITWRPTRPPVVLEDWPLVISPTFNRFTTVASWRGAYAPVRYQGKTYGIKAHEFRRFIELPRRSGRMFEIALQIHPADWKDLDRLRRGSWRIVDPLEVAASPDAFRQYVQLSGAEFSVAQGLYVDTQGGWFSDRTVRYLASGRPALVQETGFSRHIPTGQGLIAFRTPDEAVEGVERLVAEYETHCRAARRLAEDHFDAVKVIGEMATEIGLSLP